MERIDAINWMEQWAERHGVRLEPLQKLRPGETYVGPARIWTSGQVLSQEALSEYLAVARDVMVSEAGPAAGEPISAREAAAGEALPPVGITGGKVTKPALSPLLGHQAGQSRLFAAVDWVNLVGMGVNQRRNMQKLVSAYLGEGQAGLFGAYTYRNCWQWDTGAKLYWSEDRTDWLLSVNADTFELVGQERHRQFLVDLSRHQDHCTRLDCRVDDYSRQVIPLAEVRQALEADNFTGPRICEPDLAFKRGQTIKECYTFGRRGRDGGGSYVRVYDKALESQGRMLCNRLEVEYAKEKANAAFEKLIAAATSDDALAQAVGQLATGAIDFVNRQQHRHVARMDRLTWWASIVDAIGRCVLHVQRVRSTLNSSLSACNRQFFRKVARAAVVGEAMGHDIRIRMLGIIDSFRAGQEIDDVPLSPMEMAFDPLMAFK